MSSTGLLEDLGLYLETQISGLTRGTRLFGYQLPATTGNTNVSSTAPIAALIPEQGFPSIRTFVPSSGGSAAFERPAMRVRVRSTDGSGGEVFPEPAGALAAQIHNALESFPPNSTVAGGVHPGIGAVEPFSAPYLEGRDDRGRWVYAFRVLVWANP
jgi:hypothetical protein